MGFSDFFIMAQISFSSLRFPLSLYRITEPATPINLREFSNFLVSYSIKQILNSKSKIQKKNDTGRFTFEVRAMPYLLHPSLATCPSWHHIPAPLTTTTVNPIRTHPLVSLVRSGNQLGKSIVGTTTIRCMANPRRVKMVAKQIRRELSDMLLTDKVLQYAVLPEASLGADRYLSSLTTISEVEVSADLQVVKVYVSVFGDERGKEVAIAGLKSKAKYVRSELGRRMKLRLTPEIRFIEDESIERGSRVIAILDKIKNEKKGEESKEQPNSSAAHEEDNEWDDEDPDEGIIYVE